MQSRLGMIKTGPLCSVHCNTPSWVDMVLQLESSTVEGMTADILRGNTKAGVFNESSCLVAVADALGGCPLPLGTVQIS
jgi:hypothetical protein